MARYDQTPAEIGTPDSDAWPSGSVRDLTGRTLADFKVERLLGHGGMGEVYLARQLSLDRPVALKVLRPELLNNPTYMARFESEAWAAAKLNHPNIVHIYTLGGVDEIKFIAMEYVQGTNLREYLAKKGVPELPLALSIMRQAGLAVGAAGEVGLIHRDIKPENLLLTKKGQVKVADFGLCRGPDADKLHLTQPGMTLGTPMYMSPEQVQGHTLDPRSDLYSLGVTFYHMLAGFAPFHAETPVALALKHVREQPIHLAVHRPDIPKDLADLVMKLIAKDPADRYQSAGEMLRDLSRIREKIQASQAAVAAAEAVAEPESKPQPSERGRGRWSAPALPRIRLGSVLPRLGRGTIAGLVVLATLGGAALGWMARPTDLLAAGAPGGPTPPGLWMEDWQAIRKQPNPQAQYRYAQTGPAGSGRVAAWLAVPGWHPNAPTVAINAYIQLARELFRRGDADRLEALADELTAYGQDGGDRSMWASLATVARAGVGALRDEPLTVRSQFQNILNVEQLDPAIAELGMEVVLVASQRPSGSGPNDASRFDELKAKLLDPLGLSTLPRAMFD